MSGSKPPLPRGRDQITFSELVPFRSSKIRLWRSPLVAIVAFTVVFSVVLYTYRVKLLNADDVPAKIAALDVITMAAMVYILGLCIVGVHAYSKTDKPIYYYVLPGLFVYYFMESEFLWNNYYQPFEALSGGDAAQESSNLLTRIWWGFAGPGLREELLKGMPILFGAALMVWADKLTVLPPALTRLLRVRSPLDGILMGFGCGAAFILHETGGQYLQEAFDKYLKATDGNADGAVASALLLLLPRTMDGWTGHMGYAGIFGYFIGLGVLRRSLAPQLILAGWFTAALLHGLWDADLPGNDIALYCVGGAVALLAMGCFLKARQLDATLFGRGTETFGSIIVPAAPPPYTPPPYTPPPASFAPFAPTPNPGAPPPPLVAALQRPAALALALPSRTIPLVVGHTYDIDEPGLAPHGTKAEVTQHPTNPAIIGLRNVGPGTWYARLRDATIQPIETRRSLRLAEGVSIDFGNGLVAKVVSA